MCAPVQIEQRQVTASRGVRIEIQPDKLLTLLRQGSICAADLRWLDCDSKRCLLKLVMKACAVNLTDKIDDMDPTHTHGTGHWNFSVIEN